MYLIFTTTKPHTNVVFIGITAGVRSTLHLLPKGAIPTFFEELQTFFKTHQKNSSQIIKFVHPNPMYYLTAKQESEYEFKTVKYVLNQCSLNKYKFDRLDGHIGIGGASIQVSYNQGKDHLLFPFSFTTPNISSHLSEIKDEMGKIKVSNGLYFGIESCYWVCLDCLGESIFDKRIHVTVLLDRLRKNPPHDEKNKNTYKLFCEILKILPDTSDIVILSHNYCFNHIEAIWTISAFQELKNRHQKRKRSQKKKLVHRNTQRRQS
jgi:hypothetical protein